MVWMVRISFHEYNQGAKAPQSILVRIVAGDKKDEFINEAQIKNFLAKTKIYDVEGKRDIKGKGKAKTGGKNL